ncbi:transcription factor CP2-like protein 1 [Clytia hemisphaerica]|uniref:Grh/CP2 DB domain-containing protein n=1 Tax=Clytia hemisphaerica TaxID=252671 RepID=A0A7M5WQ57_9CNID
MDDDETNKIRPNTWRVDDLDNGSGSLDANLQGLGASASASSNALLNNEHTPAYDMTEVLRLQLFKEEALDANDLLQSLNESIGAAPTPYNYDSLQQTLDQLQQHFQNEEIIIDDGEAPQIKTEHTQYEVIMRAPTAPKRKQSDQTLTWLNQGQPYEIVVKRLENDQCVDDKQVKAVVSIGFHERQHQYFEYEKYEEWVLTRPGEKMIELDVPMSLNVIDANHIGSNTNEIEFIIDTSSEVKLFVKCNCLSSEFTKGKGESGVPLRLQLEIFNSADSAITDDPEYVSGCQVKVFRAKGANRKLKLEKEKIESMSKDVANQVQPSSEITIFKQLGPVERLRRRSHDTPSKMNQSGASPIQLSQLQIVNGSANTSISSPDTFLNNRTHTQHHLNSSCPASDTTTLTASSNVEETQTWLAYHRFHNYQTCLANFTGADLLRMSRSDLIQLCGPADGIRLNNALQARASRPLLTIYISPEWHQSGTGMREYHAMFLEQLNIGELKRKLAKKCGLQEDGIIGILKQGPTGIHIHIDDDFVRNFVDESHHVVEVLKDPTTGLSRIILK